MEWLKESGMVRSMVQYTINAWRYDRKTCHMINFSRATRKDAVADICFILNTIYMEKRRFSRGRVTMAWKPILADDHKLTPGTSCTFEGATADSTSTFPPRPPLLCGLDAN